jgi:galactokinase
MIDGVREQARERFEQVFGLAPSLVAYAPGRVNLIGEHTDYNDGFVLPMAIDRGVAVAAAARPDSRLRVHACAFDDTWDIAIHDLAPGRLRGWSAYVGGMLWAMRDAGLPVQGADLAIATDLPIGAGLSSSAALELAVARALARLASISWDPRAMAILARDAENRFAGVACGIMDQFAAALGRHGSALLIDCRSLETRPIRIPRAAALVVMDTGVRRSLASGAYNARREACARAVAAIRGIDPRVTALRDADPALLERARGQMDDEALRRASHVVAEIGRPTALAESLERGDLSSAGELMNRSHASLRDLYDVSSPELEAIVAAAVSHGSCYGARLTGAGFGGCAIALVRAEAAGPFIELTGRRYAEATDRAGCLFVARPSGGAHLG